MQYPVFSPAPIDPAVVPAFARVAVAPGTLPLAERRVFVLDECSPTGLGRDRWRLRYNLRTQGHGPGFGPLGLHSVSFYLPIYLNERAHWDAPRNRVRDEAPGAAALNAQLDTIRATVLEAIAASMSENQIRDLMGVGPVRKHTAYGTRSDKGTLRVATAKRVLLANGWTASHPAPAPALVAADAPPAAPAAPAHDPETAGLLARFGRAADPAAEPARLPGLPGRLPAAGDYWLVAPEDPNALPDRAQYPTLAAATRAASQQATAAGRTFRVIHCRPVARVHVAVQVDAL